uniref:Uncharacterized protein n=1 Tax=Anguilla anguilla TaxID=7936 RepID=A0A0E9V325_ANGAN
MPDRTRTLSFTLYSGIFHNIWTLSMATDLNPSKYIYS